MQSEALSQFISEKIEDMKGRDIVVIDVIDRTTFTDYMIICSANSSRHAKSIAEHIVLESRAADVQPLGVEGTDVGEWCLVDLGDAVVHIMTEATRDTYELEKLWAKD